MAMAGLRLVGGVCGNERPLEYNPTPLVGELPSVDVGVDASPYDPTLKVRSDPQLIDRALNRSPRSPAGLSTV